MTTMVDSPRDDSGRLPGDAEIKNIDLSPRDREYIRSQRSEEEKVASDQMMLAFAMGKPFVSKPDWMDEWTAGEWIQEEGAVSWIRSRPDAIQKMMIAYPPSCLVVSTRPLHIPAPGTVGIVTSYIDPGEEHPDGLVTVRQSPHGDVRAQCEPSCLAVVGYYRGLTPTKVKELLGIF